MSGSGHLSAWPMLQAESKAEFEAEQAYLKTLSLLSPEEQEKYRQRQSVSFLYMKVS